MPNYLVRINIIAVARARARERESTISDVVWDAYSASCYLLERIKKIHAKIHLKNKRGKPGPFNVAAHENYIPVDKLLTILAHLHGVNDGGDQDLDGWVDTIIDCSLFYNIKKAKVT